jgi:hypothetical protein
VTYWRHPRAVWRRSPGRIVIAGARTDDVRVLGGLGVLVWEVLDRPATLEEIGAEVADALDVAPPAVHDGVRAALEELLAEGFLRKAGG